MSIKSLLLIFLGFCSILGFAKENKVLIIGIDGVRPDAMVVAETPNIDDLISNSTYSLDAINEGTTSSGPSWSAMLTGVWQSKHGVNDNSFNGENYNEYPHFFKYLEDTNPELHTASICQWDPINDQLAYLEADYVKNVSSEAQLITETVNYLSNNDPDALFIHFDDVDGAGHGQGYSPTNPPYLTAIEEVDAGIGQIMQALKGRANYENENWLIIISTDHGGIGHGHGGNSIEERNIFVICSGDEVPNIEIKKDSTLTSVPPVENCLQDSVELYFSGTSKVTTPLKDVFNFGTDKDFSIECRIRTTNSGDVAIVTDKDWDTGRNPGVVFSFVGGGSGPWKVNIGDGTNRADINGNVVHDNLWHTLSATFDRDGRLIIYADGAVLDSVSIASIGDIYSGFPISFGADANNSYAYKGHIAEVRVFSEILAPSTINNWNCKKIDDTHENYNSLIGYWQLTEGNNSQVVTDYSTTEAHGNISNATWKNAKDTIETWEYDFSNTPRTVDVAVSAMKHMCITINEDWNLDGNVVGAVCNTPTSIEEKIINDKIKVYPNPGSEYVNFETSSLLYNEDVFVSIFNSYGNLVIRKQIKNRKLRLDRGNLNSGLYFYKVESQNKPFASGKFTLR